MFLEIWPTSWVRKGCPGHETKNEQGRGQSKDQSRQEEGLHGSGQRMNPAWGQDLCPQ